VQISDITCFERDSALNHGVQKNPKTPNIGEKSLVAFVENYFRSEVSRGTTLLVNDLAFLDQATNTEIA
jgi:hypothetical protein